MNDIPTSVNDSSPALEVQALLDAAVDGILVIDHLGRILTFNRAAEWMFGYSAHDVVGRGVALLMSDEEQHTPGHDMALYVATHTPQILRRREIEGRRKDGTRFPASITLSEIPGSHPPCWLGFIRDDAERHESEAEAHRLQERLMHVSRFATVGEMASGIAHELNQPLAAIATYAHACDRLLGAPDADIDEVRAALKQIAEQAVRAGDIIRKLRGLARNERPQRLPSDVNSVIDELNDLINSDAGAHGVTYRHELQPNLPQVVLDSSQIQQVVMNLVHNALDSLALAQVEARELVITTRLTPGGDVEIAVCDNGVGVHDSIKDRLFTPFCSTKPTGTGLGLPMSRTLVRAHEGALEYQPNEPRGACFNVRLPAMQEMATSE